MMKKIDHQPHFQLLGKMQKLFIGPDLVGLKVAAESKSAVDHRLIQSSEN